MIEQNQEAIDKALKKINATYERNVKLGRISTDQKKQIMSLFSACTIWKYLMIEI